MFAPEANQAYSVVASLVTRNHRAARILTRYLEPIVTQRLAERLNSDGGSAGTQPARVSLTPWVSPHASLPHRE